MLTVLLHAIGAAAMMAPGLFLPWPYAWPIAVAVALFWTAREILQGRQKYGRWVLPGDSRWSEIKTREALWPALTAIACAGGMTWRALSG